VGALGLLLLVGCGTKEDTDSGGVGNEEGPADDSGTAGDTGETMPMLTSGTGGNEEGPMGSSGGSEDGEDTDDGPSSFIADPDGGGISNECDIWTQDCPEGEKCMPWANDGGSSWNATRCSPINDNPGQPGDECTVEGGGVSGLDDCDVASMCWDVDPETNLGVCVGFCEGSEDAPLCSNPDDACSITNDGVLILCLPTCDPLLQDCADGQACYPESNGFICSPDASGEMGVYGDPCEYINVCDPGFWCANARSVPNCVGAIGCCASYCDVTEPDPFCEPDTECTIWHEEGTAPPGEEDIGVCIVPA
jgi:hypothetical protein